MPRRRTSSHPAARRAAVVVAVVAIAVAAVALALSLGDDERAPALTRAELSAEAFADSMGVVIHLNYVDTAYGRRAEVVARLRELGVGHVREAMPTPPVGAQADGLRALRALGVRATLGTGDPNVPPARAVADALTVMRGSVDAFEGPNELDNSGDPAWPVRLQAYMPALRAAVRTQAPGVPLIGPSFIRPGNRARVGDLPGLVNGHPYPGGKPPEPVLGAAVRELGARRGGARGVVFTETGYHNALADLRTQPPVTEAVAAVYLPRLYATAFGAGVRRTFVYELADEVPEPGLRDAQQHFGLLRADLTPKPAFTAIRTLLAALRFSPGRPARRGRLGWVLQVEGGSDRDVQRLVLVRGDGSHVLVLWRAVSVWDRDRRLPLTPAPLGVRLHFDRPARDVAVWRPSTSPAPVQRLAATQELPLQLGGDLVVVSLR